MAPSFDFGLSSLLCEEENDSISFDFFSDVDDNVNHNQIDNQNPNLKVKDETEYYVLDLPWQNEARLTLLTSKENEQNEGLDAYLIRLKNQNLFLAARQAAVDWISKVHGQFSFGPLCAYLSVNYLDRFLAVYGSPDTPWMMQLLSVTCLSLAAKVDETETPTILDLQGSESRYLFEAKTILKMELIVLATLRWRMQSVTPFSYIDSFISKLNDGGQSQTVSRSLILKSFQLILCLIQGIDFLEFQPSEIAAAVAIYVVNIEVEKIDFSAVFENLNKERVLKCDEFVIKGCTMGFRSGTIITLPESPIGVVEAAILSHKNDDSPTCAKRMRFSKH
ncbi:cyclin-D4-2-like [Bidens hawaiensis]|uniref:cyclin-D4-2-like n=1 Tax=Bidens hawaiensis TaxID=980011 RepID=UPI004049B15D